MWSHRGRLHGLFPGRTQGFPRSSAARRNVQGKLQGPARIFRIAVSAGLAEELPTLPGLLRGIAQAPGSHLHFYLSEKQLQKYFKRNAKNQGPRVRGEVLQRTCVLTKSGEAEKENIKVRALYITPREFLSRQEGSLDGVCPGS